MAQGDDGNRGWPAGRRQAGVRNVKGARFPDHADSTYLFTSMVVAMMQCGTTHLSKLCLTTCWEHKHNTSNKMHQRLGIDENTIPKSCVNLLQGTKDATHASVKAYGTEDLVEQ